jgi:hypothetical protein
MKSAAAMLLKKTERDIWHRGEVYADKGQVRTVCQDEKHIEAEVRGTQSYAVHLKFAPNGISQDCNCLYFTRHRCICKHIVAVAILWDESRGIPRPDEPLVQLGTVSPPGITQRDIARLFDKPLEADLELVRSLAELTALGGRARPHSQLPKAPKIAATENTPLTQREVQRCYSEMKRWSRRQAYDPYFCAGEMVAAFCELLGVVRLRLAATEVAVAAEVLLSAQKFHLLLVTELIDDSQGLREISEAYLDDVYFHLRRMRLSDQDRTALDLLFAEFEKRRGVN